MFRNCIDMRRQIQSGRFSVGMTACGPFATQQVAPAWRSMSSDVRERTALTKRTTRCYWRWWRAPEVL